MGRQGPVDGHWTMRRRSGRGGRSGRRSARPVVRGLRVGREVLRDNLLSSVCLDRSCPYELIVARNCPNAAEGLNIGLEQARHEWVVCVHQDVFLPEGWDRSSRPATPRGRTAIRADRRQGRLRGHRGDHRKAGPRPLAAERIGWVVDRGRELHDGPELPARSRRSMSCCWSCGASGLRFDPALGFHLYGADICLQAREQGLAVVAIAPCAITIRRASGCRRRFMRVPGSSPASGVTGCRSPRRA